MWRQRDKEYNSDEEKRKPFVVKAGRRCFICRGIIRETCRGYICSTCGKKWSK